MEKLQEKFEMLKPHLNEKQRRLYAASEAIYGEHGIKGDVSRATGVSYREIRRGLKELQEPPSVGVARGGIRKEGGGRKKITETDQKIIEDLRALVESTTRGDPMSPLQWTCKSLRILSRELKAMGHEVSYPTVGTLLGEMGYTLQANRKKEEGSDHPDRNAQFEYINEKVKEYLLHGNPAISVDCKKSALIGNYKNNGREYYPAGEAPEVLDHDFIDKELGKAIPYGVYDLNDNAGFVNVGIDHDTSVFAVESIRQWWNHMGRGSYPDAHQLLIMADGGGSNGYRRRLWKTELSKLAKETGLEISVCHFPTGTSRWNKIEHRLFSRITMNWRGRSLTSIEVVVNLIAATTTTTGLTVQCVLDNREYPNRIKVSNKDLADISIIRSDFHGDWNYTLLP